MHEVSGADPWLAAPENTSQVGKLPAILLYDGDWCKDTVAGCTLGAQGLWLRMMFVGHNSERYGYLQLNGVAMPPASIARRCGCSLEEYTSLLSELTSAGVPSCTPDGIIFSRRMVRDAQERAAAKERKQRSRSCHTSVTPLSPIEDVNDKEVAVEFDCKEVNLEDFDGQVAFAALCSVYKKAERSRIATDQFLMAVEWVAKQHKLSWKQAALYITRKAAVYCERERFQKGMTKWLEEKIFEQDETVWGRNGDGTNTKQASASEQRRQRILANTVGATNRGFSDGNQGDRPGSSALMDSGSLSLPLPGCVGGDDEIPK